jgi:hypothetical protein
MCFTARHTDMALPGSLDDAIGKLAWTGKLTANAGTPAPNPRLNSPKTVLRTVPRRSAYGCMVLVGSCSHAGVGMQSSIGTTGLQEVRTTLQVHEMNFWLGKTGARGSGPTSAHRADPRGIHFYYQGMGLPPWGCCSSQM